MPVAPAKVLRTGESGRSPCVSVIVPVYRTEAYLRECLDSFVHQTLQEIEIICVNDAQGQRIFYHEIKSPLWNEDGKTPWGLCGISIDITQSRLAEEALAKLSRAVEQSAESIIFTDLDGKIEYVNDAFLAVTGYTREEVVGRNPRLLQSGKTPRERYAALWSALHAGEAWRGELINTRKDGSEFLE